MPLSDTAIRKAKPQAKAFKLFDGGGLYVEVTPSGGKWWRWKYRRPVTGKENRLSFGTYPDVGLADARDKRDAARKLLAAGTDPGESRKAERIAGAERAANSFEVVAREWLAKRDWVPDYLSKVTGWLENDVFPWIGGRPVAELSAPEFLQVARRIEERGAIESAHRILRICGQVMRYAIATGRATRNPVADLQGALPQAPTRHHAAITDTKAIGGLLRAMDGYSGTFPVRCALKLAPMLFVRPGELRMAEWSEFDLDAAQWNIPAERMKMREPHLVPLSSQAVAILRELHPLTGRGQFVFPSARSPKRPMSNNAVNAALRRMGFTTEKVGEDGKRHAVSTMTGHGFRAMARTVLDETLGFRADYIEHQLAHAVRDPNGRAYNRTAHLSERRKMMQAWADYLDTLREEKSNIVPIKRKKTG